MSYEELRERFKTLGYDLDTDLGGYYLRKYGTTDEKYFNDIQLVEAELFNMED